MRLNRVSLQNFRNYESAEVGTDADLVLILGDNAAGKTNFLESIYFLSRLKSFRAPDEFLVKIGTGHLQVMGAMDERAFEVIVQKSPLRRQFKIDNQKTKRGFWNSFRSVLFVPGDLNIFTAGPSARRKFLDETLSQKYLEYAAASVSLEHTLKQKSSLLEMLARGEAREEELDFWNEQLAASAAIITEFRREFCSFVSERLGATIDRLSGLRGLFALVVKSDASTKAEYLAKLESHKSAEIRSGQNLIGPHRDDFTITKDGILNIYNSSRGELRTQVLALKLLQAQYLSDEKQKPAILLDDVFSELDETRRSRLIEGLTGHQIFITSTEEHHLPVLGDQALILKVRGDQIIS